MRVERVYAVALRLYPADYRARFAAEMLATLRQAADDHCGDGAWASLRFAWTETASLVLGIGLEWIAKAASDRSSRGRYLPDCRRMRPPGVTARQWAAGLPAIDRQDGGSHGG